MNQALPIGTVLRGKAYSYTIEKVLGQGTFGITYLASTRIKGPLGEVTVQVAVKEFFAQELDTRRPDGSVGERSGIASRYARSFWHESDNLSRMKHPCIVNVLESFETNGTYYYSMEYLSGGNLNSLVSGKGIPEMEAIEIVRQVGGALSYMHLNRMMHLDLKPLNIMMKGDGTPVVIDFGLSKQYDSLGEPESSSTIGLGTPGYAPIEQAFQSSGNAFQPTLDIYALGATLYKMLTGETPPQASVILNDGFPEDRLKDKSISSRTIDAIRKAMSPVRKNRPQTVKEFLSMLEEPVVYSEKKQPKQDSDTSWRPRLFAIQIGSDVCRLAFLDQDQSVRVIDSFATSSVASGDKWSLFESNRLEPFLRSVISRYEWCLKQEHNHVHFIVPSTFTYRGLQFIFSVCSDAGIEIPRVFYEDSAAAMGYLLRTGRNNYTGDGFEFCMVSPGSAPLRKMVAQYAFGGGILEQVDLREQVIREGEWFIAKPYNEDSEKEVDIIVADPDDALLGGLSYDNYGTIPILLLDALRNGDLNLCWGKQGDTFKTVVPDGFTLPFLKSVKVVLGEARNFLVCQGKDFPAGYLGGIFLEEGELLPDAEVEFILESDHLKRLGITIKSGDFKKRKILLEPYRGETIPTGKCPYLEVVPKEDDSTQYKAPQK